MTVENWYPEFEAGQVISHDDLNQMQSYLRSDALVQRRQFIGFGVLDGLASKLNAENQWELAAGTAIDQVGRIIQVPKPYKRNLEELIPGGDDVEHPLIKPVPTVCGFTPLLKFHQTRRSNLQEDVDPVTRGTRAEPSYSVLMVPGRLALPQQPMFYQIRPICLTTIPVNGAGKLSADWLNKKENLVVAYKKAGLEREAHSILDKLRLSGDLAKDLCLIALLNELIYTGWNWARADIYNSSRTVGGPYADNAQGDCANDETVQACDQSGIALGWLYVNDDGNWEWDWRYRMGYHLGLSALGAAHGFPSQRIMRDCLDRAAQMLLAHEALQCIRPRRNNPAKAQWLTPFHYVGGVETWMPDARWDMPRQWAQFWPIDPLRGRQQPPQPVAPGMFDEPVDNPIDSEAPSLSPTIFQPLNEPYLYSVDPARMQIDPLGKGLIRLTGLLGHDLAEVDKALERVGFPKNQIVARLDQCEAADMELLRPLLMASRDASIYIISRKGMTDSTETNIVTAFAYSHVDRASRPDGSGPTPVRIVVEPPDSTAPFWRRWIARGIGILRWLFGWSWGWIAAGPKSIWKLIAKLWSPAKADS